MSYPSIAMYEAFQEESVESEKIEDPGRARPDLQTRRKAHLKDGQKRNEDRDKSF